MRRIVVITSFIIFASFVSLMGSGKDSPKNALSTIEQLRLKYYAAVEEEDSLNAYESYLKSNLNEINKYNPAMGTAFQAGIEAVKSKHAFWPHKKLSHLNSSMDFLKKAVGMEPDNLEIRFMRFSILHYVPSFLGFGQERESDARAIAVLLVQGNNSALDSQIKKGIVEFMLRSDRLTDSETALLKKNFPDALIDE